MADSRSRNIVFGLLIILAIGGLDACGNGNDKQAANEPRRAIRPADNALARRIVLNLSDFPSGWRADLSKEENDSTSACINLDFSDLTLTGRADSKDFAMGDNTEATSVARIFQSTGQARGAFGKIASEKTAQCLADYFETEAKKDKDLKRQDVKVGDVSVGRLSFPSLGDRSAAYQIALSLETKDISPTVYLDLVLVQRSRANAVLLFVDVLSPFDENLKRSLSRTVARRMPAD